MYMALHIKFFTIRQTLLASIPITITLVVSLCLSCDGFAGTVFFALGTYELHLRADNTNNKIMLNNKLQLNPKNIKSKLDRYILEHNNLCRKVDMFSKFWKDMYLILLLTFYQSTLMLLYQVLFERIEFYIIRLLFLIIIFNCYSILFFLQYLFALLSYKMHRQYTVLARSQWLLTQTNSSLRSKLKVQTYMERLSSNRRIGISIGSVTVITFPLFSTVS